MVPNGTLIRPEALQRYGISVTYDGAQETFSISSGSPGDTSEIEIDFTVTNTSGSAVTNGEFAKFMGFEATSASDSKYSVGVESDAVRGVASLPAITRGSSIAVNVNNNFSVDASNNTFVVSVDDVKGTLTLPISAGYTLDSFIVELEKSINQLASDSGSSVSGVKVEYDATTNGLVFTTGTNGTDSFIKVAGSATWGLAETGAAGPTGNRYGDASGHTCVAVAGPITDVRTLETASSDREANMWAFTDEALDIFLGCLNRAP